jgi:5-methylcytosine-specific restriction protein B
MNTADRSITSLDTALRRRFSFIEFPPQPRLLEKIKIRNGSVEINLEEVLDSLNKRIEFFLDKDHLIGHSYFMGLASWEQLCETYRDKIIPLLREYFYNDWEKIALVLGDNPENGKSDIERFILKRLLSSDTLFGFSDDRYEDRESYEINHHLVSGNYMELSPAFFVKGLIKA